MKYCPQCKTQYQDETLKFCLNDGASLMSIYDEQETRISHNAANFGQPFGQNFPTVKNQPQSNSSLIIALLIGLFVILPSVGAGIYFLFLRNPNSPIAQNMNIQNSTPVQTATPKDGNDELKEKIANLERQLQEQKKNSNSTTLANSNAKPQIPITIGGKPTARVGSTGDGFLAMRTEPSVRNGTRILKIPSGATVELENCESRVEVIDGRRGRWCMVSYGGKTGWAFDFWLNY